MTLPTSINLFSAWATKHKELIALEDQAAALERSDPLLVERIVVVKAEADAMREAAIARFQTELAERGLGV